MAGDANTTSRGSRAGRSDEEVDAEQLGRRLLMVERDLAGRGISDPEVLRAMGALPRHRFLDDPSRSDAYADRPLPIGEGQTISQPYIVAMTAQALRLTPSDRVLDVGTGSGYAAAVLGEIAAEVWSIERHPSLAEQATRTLDALGITDVHVRTGDGSFGLPEQAPFDAIAVAAAASDVPTALTDQLADGGRLVIPIGPVDRTQQLLVIERHGESLRRRHVADVRFVPLVSDRPDPRG